MYDADGTSQTSDDQAALLEQVLLDAAQKPKSMRSAAGDEVQERDIRDIISAHQYIGRQSSPFRTVQLIPGGTG